MTLIQDLIYRFEDGIPEANTNNGTIVIDESKEYEGARSARCRVTGIGASYARNVIRPPTLGQGDIAWAGGAFWLPPEIQSGGYVNIMRFDDYGGTHQILGIESFSNSNLWHVGAGTYDDEYQVGDDFALPTSSWFWLDLGVKIGSGGWAQVYLNGDEVVSEAGDMPTEFTRLRHGIVSVGAGAFPGGLWMDRISLRRTQLGPIGSPPPAPAPPGAPADPVFKSTDGRNWDIDSATLIP